MPSGTSGKENGTVPKRSWPVMVETDCDVVHCPEVGNEHWMFDPRLADIINQFARLSYLASLGDYILTNIDCLCWAGKNGRVMIYFTNLCMASSWRNKNVRKQPTLFQRVGVHHVSNIIIYKLVCYSWNHTVGRIKVITRFV